TPTKLHVKRIAQQIGGVVRALEFEINPSNPTEKKAVSARAVADRSMPPLGGRYTYRVGDICLLALGEIVNRYYDLVRYQATAMYIVNSPVEDQKLCQQMRSIWSRQDSAKTLFESLLLDYSSDGVLNGKAPAGLRRATRFQAGAVVRLLYYFPEE